MAKVYITEHYPPTLHNGNALAVAAMPPITTQTVAIGVTSVQSSAFGTHCRMVCVHTDAICSIEFGSSPTATANSRRLAANATEYFEVRAGDKVAVITNT